MEHSKKRHMNYHTSQTYFFIAAAAIIIAAGFFARPFARAHTAAQSTTPETQFENHKNLDEIMTDLLQKYSKAKIQDLSCMELTDEDFEKIGDGVMEDMHRGEAHRRMDQMMGGEGSSSLQAAHIRMGREYMGCAQNSAVVDGNTQEQEGGGSMMGNFGMMGSQMVGGSVYTGVFGLLWTVTWILIVILLVVMIRYFWNKGKDKK